MLKKTEYKVTLTTIKEIVVCIQKYQVFLEYTKFQCEKISHFCLLRIWSEIVINNYVSEWKI